MRDGFINEIGRIVEGRLLVGEMMSRHTTLRVGGPAEVMVEPHDLNALQALLRWASRRGVEARVVGAGSNILAADSGVGGIVIRLSGAPFREIELKGEEVVAGAGTAIADLVRFCAENGAGGLEFLSSIPGTVGGAVAMNAGAWGKDVSRAISGVTVVAGDGTVSALRGGDLGFGYRSCSLPAASVIVEAAFAVERREPAEVQMTVSRYAAERRGRFPSEPSAGSVFKNPEGDYAGRLIEAAGLKGAARGGAQISEVHANFIVNRGGASARDVFELMELASGTVLRMFSVRLETEIHILGGVET